MAPRRKRSGAPAPGACGPGAAAVQLGGEAGHEEEGEERRDVADTGGALLGVGDEGGGAAEEPEGGGERGAGEEGGLAAEARQGGEQGDEEPAGGDLQGGVDGADADDLGRGGAEACGEAGGVDVDAAVDEDGHPEVRVEALEGADGRVFGFLEGVGRGLGEVDMKGHGDDEQEECGQVGGGGQGVG